VCDIAGPALASGPGQRVETFQDAARQSDIHPFNRGVEQAWIHDDQPA